MPSAQQAGQGAVDGGVGLTQDERQLRRVDEGRPAESVEHLSFGQGHSSSVGDRATRWATVTCRCCLAACVTIVLMLLSGYAPTVNATDDAPRRASVSTGPSPITELASRVGKLRPSVSRSLKLLQQQALVTYEDSEWRATRPGQAEADRAKQKLRGMEAQLQRTFRALAPRIPMPVIPTETFRTLATFSLKNGVHSVDYQ